MAERVFQEKGFRTGMRFSDKGYMENIYRITALCWGKIAEELSSLLGVGVEFELIDNRICGRNRGEFDGHGSSSAQIVAGFDVTGDIEYKSFLSIDSNDALMLGGTLLLLPEPELQSIINKGDYTPDMEDACGEIINIITGALTAAFVGECGSFLPLYYSGFQFIPTAAVNPLYWEIATGTEYYLSIVRLVIEEIEGGVVCLALPVNTLPEICQESGAAAVEEKETISDSGRQLLAESYEQSEDTEEVLPAEKDDCRIKDGSILLIGDDDGELVKIKKVLMGRGYAVRVLSFNDNIDELLSDELRAVYLVAREFDERMLALAIKVSSGCSKPVIAAAPEWTKKKVMKAVKYGVKDILLTPAEQQDIESSVDNNVSCSNHLSGSLG
jgi:ActR/RegA family two-component response regulator